jgi:hypothetical protein
VLGGDALIAEVAIDLIDSIQSSHDQSLEVEFGRNAKIKVHIQSIMMGDKRTSRRATSLGLHHGRLHFQKVPFIEELPNRPNDGAPKTEDPTYLRIGQKIQIPLAIAYLHI